MTGTFTVTLQVAFIAALSAEVAVMVTSPFPTAVIFPFESTVATASLLVDHVTAWLVASFGKTEAVSVSESPLSRVRVVLLRLTLETGTTVVGFFMLMVQESVNPPSLVVTVNTTVPSLWIATTPSLVIVAMLCLSEDQVTLLSVAFPGLTSIRSFKDSPYATSVGGSRIFTPVTFIGFTVIVQVADLSPAVAVIVAVPSDFPVTAPSTTVAINSSLDSQITVGSVAPSGNTVAVSVSFSPIFNDSVV